MLDEESTIQKNTTDRLISALREGGFVLYAQHIVPLGVEGRDRPFQEILTRFREEEEKLLPPGTFFPLLEEYHLLPYMDRWVVGRLASWIRHQREQKADWPVPRNSINLAADTLLDTNFGEYTGKYIEKAKLAPGTFTFELSWETATGKTAELRQLMTALKPAGCDFTIAGFDGSPASFAILKSLAPTFVKLNYSIVKDIDRVLSSCERAESITAELHSRGMRTIAEYVESAAVLDQLKAIGVDYAQGMAISAPRRLR
jgi:EAL domain-containing protein (putative c-di-GMP-specific phosphodiesterase class I)